MLSISLRSAIPWLAASMALVAFIMSQFAAPAPAEARPWALAATDLAETSGTTCGAIWSEYFEFPVDLEEQASAKNGWIVNDRVYSGSLASLAAEASGRAFGTGVDSSAFVNGTVRGEQVSLELVRAPTKTEAWIVAAVTRPIPCEESSK